MIVRVYRNLHKGNFTIQHYIKGKGWRKYEGTHFAQLINCKFLVYENTRQKVMREKKKYVHAYIEGKYLNYVDTAPFTNGKIFESHPIRIDHIQ